jgi:hypothetical protein
MALPQYVFEFIIIHPAPGAIYIIKLNKRPTGIRALHVFSLAIGYANGIAVHRVNACGNIGNVRAIDLDIGAVININPHLG